MPSLRVLDCLVKNVTVIGIMGNIQGVSKATKPAIKPAMKITTFESFFFSFCWIGADAWSMVVSVLLVSAPSV